METFAGMRMFTEVVDSGSFSAAGRRLGLAASSVARAIGALENQLGVRLLNRTTRKLGLTEAGRLYHERSRRILAEVEEARLSVSQLEAAPRGTLRLNVPVVFGRLHIAPALPDFLALHPALRVDLAVTDAFVDLVEEGVDLAIRIGELEDSSLIARRLAPNRRVLCASPAYLERHGIPISPDDLSEHNCLMYKQQNRSVWRLRDDARIHEIRVSGSLLANNADVLHTAALGGVGLTILPIWLVGRDIQRGALKIVLADYQVSPGALDTNIYAVFPHSRHLSAKVRAFIDFMRERIGPHPYWEVDDRRVCAKPPLEAAAS
jgi:DNA-binding transcriptional LysR family regulator